MIELVRPPILGVMDPLPMGADPITAYDTLGCFFCSSEDMRELDRSQHL